MNPTKEMTRWSIRQSISRPTDDDVDDNALHENSATSHTDNFRGSFNKAKSVPERDSILLTELDLSPPTGPQKSVLKFAFSDGHRLALSPNPTSPSKQSAPMTAPPSLAAKISQGRSDGLAAYLKSPLLVEAHSRSIRRKSSMKEEVEDAIRKPSNHYRDKRKSQMRPSDVMTMDQLRFSSLGLYGRDKEQAKLHSCLERMMEISNQDIIQNLLWDTHQNLNFNMNATPTGAGLGASSTFNDSESSGGLGGDAGRSSIGFGGIGGGGTGVAKRRKQLGMSLKCNALVGLVCCRPTCLSKSVSRVSLRLLRVFLGEKKVCFLLNQSSLLKIYFFSLLLQYFSFCVVFISGYSGTGKTALATAIERKVWKQGGAFLVGKFDMYQRDEPYTGISSACEELCSYLVRLMLSDNVGGADKNNVTGNRGSISRLHNTNNSLENLSNRTSSQAREIVVEIIGELGEELFILTQVIPELKDLVEQAGMDDSLDSLAAEGVENGDRRQRRSKQREQLQQQERSTNGAGGYVESKNRFNYAFQRFIRVLARYLSPLVIVLDDLQWADLASLDLLEVLITDVGNPFGLMVIGCYRSNEVDKAHISSKMIRDLKQRKTDQRRRQQMHRRHNNRQSQLRLSINESNDLMSDFSCNTSDTPSVNNSITNHVQSTQTSKQENDYFDITEINVGNLNVKDVNQMVMDLLNDDDIERTYGLAEILFQKTCGNVFFLIHFMYMLFEHNLLEFNLGLLKWMWDEETIINETSSTENVVDLMKRQMKKLPSLVSRLLQLAACLGSTFDERTLNTVWKDFCQRENASAENESLLPPPPLEFTSDAALQSIEEQSPNPQPTPQNEKRKISVAKLVSGNPGSPRNSPYVKHEKVAAAKVLASNKLVTTSPKNSPKGNKNSKRVRHKKPQSPRPSSGQSPQNSPKSTGGKKSVARAPNKSGRLSPNQEIRFRHQTYSPTRAKGDAGRRSVANLVSAGKVDVATLLSFLIEEGYIYLVSGTAGRYRWVHDKIQEAAFSLIPEEEVRNIQSRVGFVLVGQLSQEELEAGIFVVVNLLNAGFDENSYRESAKKFAKRRIMLAELNLRAAKKAVKLSAFESGAKYATAGIKMLPDDRWLKHYILSLELYSTAAETEGYLGMVEEMKNHCNEVLDQKRGRVMDKLRVYNVLMDSLYIREDLHASTKLCLDVLGMLGCRFPKHALIRNILTLRCLIRLKATAKRHTKEAMSNLPLLQEPQRIEMMKLMDKLVTYCYVTGNTLLPLAISRNLRWSVQYGVCLASPPSYALTGVILAGVLYDFKAARTYAENALLALQNLNSELGEQTKMVESRTMLIAYVFVLPWTSPIQGMMQPLLRGYEIGKAIVPLILPSENSVLIVPSDFL